MKIGIIKYITIMFVIFLAISCFEEEQKEEEKKCSCESWEICDSETKSCKLKENMCVEKKDCKENFSCNEKHECVADETRDIHCDDNSTLKCKTEKPTCEDNFIPAIKDECWICVNKDSCEPKVERDSSCDDHTTLSCNREKPTCEDNKILAIIAECWSCVDKNSCLDETRDIHCDDNTELSCKTSKPECETGYIASVVNSCWKCLNSNDCKEKTDDGRDHSCDDGKEITCNDEIPTCESHEILAHKDGCYSCVNKITCLPWGEANCKKDANCKDNEYCNICATSSGPLENDCIAACETHKCTTEENATCDLERIECGEEFAIVREGCWVCVDSVTCNDIVERDTHCDDGGEITCGNPAPHCESYNILAHKDGCYYCVDPETCKPSECHFANQCSEKDWNLAQMGHWSCEEGKCKGVIDEVNCSDGICDENLGETENSCPEDCHSLEKECETTSDCLTKTWEGNESGHWTCWGNLCIEIADPVGCGNGACEGGDTGETIESCPADCN